MINKNRVVRGLAGLLAIGVVGGLASGGAAPQLAAADPQSGGHLPSTALLKAADLSDAGWKDTVTGDIGSDDGALLGRCAGPTPDLAPGFVELRGTGLYSNDPNISGYGNELVMSFKTNADARDYVSNYRTAIEGRCLDLYGPKKWHVTRSSKVTLQLENQRARTWTVTDKTAKEETVSASMVRVDDRVALVWLMGYPKNPAKTLNLHRLVQAAADRV
jgi:hypothetical protein